MSEGSRLPGPSGGAAHRAALRAEFTRAAKTFTARTKGRFSDLDAVSFARVRWRDTVLEVGSGAGGFLELFEGHAGRLIGVDVTPAMLHEARRLHPEIRPVVADGARLPFASRSIDLVCSAQMLHHVHRPLEILKEMRRVAAQNGSVLIVDQVASEKFEEALAMNELDLLRDPSHAACRPPSALRVLVMSAGLTIIDEKIIIARQRFSRWMWAGEFPQERIDRVRSFIDERGAQTGMGFERDGDDYTFTRRRIMLLAARDDDQARDRR